MFQIRWHIAPRNALAAAWIAADSPTRRLINSAVGEIEQTLRRNPFAAGESRRRGRRIIFVLPLAVVFRIEQDEKTVSILDLWPIRPRKR